MKTGLKIFIYGLNKELIYATKVKVGGKEEKKT